MMRRRNEPNMARILFFALVGFLILGDFSSLDPVNLSFNWPVLFFVLLSVVWVGCILVWLYKRAIKNREEGKNGKD